MSRLLQTHTDETADFPLTLFKHNNKILDLSLITINDTPIQSTPILDKKLTFNLHTRQRPDPLPKSSILVETNAFVYKAYLRPPNLYVTCMVPYDKNPPPIPTKFPKPMSQTGIWPPSFIFRPTPAWNFQHTLNSLPTYKYTSIQC